MTDCKITYCMITTKHLFDDLYLLKCESHNNIVGVFCLEEDKLGSNSSIIIDGRMFYYHAEYYSFLEQSN